MFNTENNSRPLILLFGANGQVGWELRRSLSVLGRVIALHRDSLDYCGDLENTDGITKTIEQLQPDVVVNAAAYTAVDQAEKEYDKAYLINALAVARMAQCCQSIHALLVHYSTDYVFDGSGQHARVETDPTQAINTYGLSKLEGEQLIQRYCDHYLIFRTSWVYASRGANFAKSILRLAKEKPELKIIDDQIGAPTGADLIADVTAHAVVQTLHQKNLAGLYHLVPNGFCSWRDYAVYLLQVAHHQGIVLQVVPEQVQALSSSQYPTIAKRPLNSRLSPRLLEDKFNLKMPDWKNGVERWVLELN